MSVIAVAAMLLSVAGIAYMSAVSYPDELEVVDASARELQRHAQELSASVKQHLHEVVTGLSTLLDQRSDTGELERHEVDAASLRFFLIDDQGVLRYPAKEPLRGGRVEREASLPDRGFSKRQKRLAKARSLELGTCAEASEEGESQPCRSSPAGRQQAESLYKSLVPYEDTGPDALLGLARLYRSDARLALAARAYRELAERFGDRGDSAGVSYALLADLGLAEVTGKAAPFLSLVRGLLDRRYAGTGAVLQVAAASALEQLRAMELDDEQVRELESLEAELARKRRDALLASRIERTSADVIERASPTLRGIVAFWDRSQMLVFRKSADGSVVGVVLSERELGRITSELASSQGLRTGLRAVVEAIEGAPAVPSAAERAAVGFGQPFSHLRLVLLDDGTVPDPAAEIASARRRHRAITGGLVAILILGLVATIRGAARERELARLKSDFVTTVSHELKTPLTSIRMFAEMLQQGVAGEDRERQERYHEIIVKESERLGLLIANLLDYSQIERGTRTYKPEREPAAAIAEDAAETFLRLREGEGQILEVETDEAAEASAVRVDRDVIIQCLLNLLSNAAKYGEGQPITLSVQLDVPRSLVLFAVQDRGPGIPANEQERIFREFYRAPQARSSGVEGTGLGLALVKRHIEAQGGAVHVDSTMGRGSTFTITLPVALS